MFLLTIITFVVFLALTQDKNPNSKAQTQDLSNGSFLFLIG
jgi:hypothetical protein